MDSITWNLLDKYFKDNPYNLVAHHLDSYNDFFSKGIFQIFRENNPIRFIEREEDKKNVEISENKNECFIYLGGKNGDKLYFGKPIIYDDTNADGITKPYPHYMYPNDARLRNMTYGITIHYDLEVDFVYYNGNVKTENTKLFEKIYLGRFPIMLQSNLCILKGLTTDARFNLGECRNDYGGYFIIGGKEKVIVSQEKFGDNMLYVRKYNKDDAYSYSCEVHSVSEDSSKPIRYTSVKIVAPDATYTNNQIVVDIPNVKKPIPLFILMRALGVISDKSIIEYCLLDLKTNSNMIDLFIPSIHDANKIFTQQIALEFISKFTKRQTVSATQDILMNYFLSHVGEDNYLNKAYFIGFMVNKLLRVYTGKEETTNRDNFKFKRVEVSGTLIYDLFREYFLIQNREIFLKIDKEFYYRPAKYRTNFVSLIEDNLKEIFKHRAVEEGFKKGFKGNWGADVNTKRLGLVQDLNRLSWFTHISHLRKINLPLDPTAKVVGPHLLHNSQWGLIDPVDTPDGGNIGLHKHLAISSAITNGFSSFPLIKWIRANTPLKLLNECSPELLASFTKVFVNGNWIGVLDNPIETVNTLKLFRRNGIIPVYTSISFSYESNIIYIYTDSGRLTRPIFYRDSNMEENKRIVYTKISYNHGNIKDIIESRKYTWEEAISGFEKKNDKFFNVRNNILYDTNVLYPSYNTLQEILEAFEKNRAIIDYIDTSEEEGALIANKPEDLKNNKYYTHCEIDASLIFGVMGNSIIYPESNQFPRDCFSCGQSRQAVSVYHSNYQMRMDKMGIILNYGQTPLVKSRYLDYINHEEQPYGVNAIVAIMSYTGYNVEDAILINEGAVKRGIFRTTYYTTYEAREESGKVSGSNVDTFFSNIETKPGVKGRKEGFDYSYLDKHGLVKENTEINEKVVLVGELTTSSENKGVYTDNSKTTKKGQLGYVDKSFISEGEEGFRIAKVRIREDRLPAIGDKMACALPTQQVLTNEGWVEIKDIDIATHKVATLDTQGNMCYEYPTAKFEYNHNGEMYSVKNKQVEVVCTLNHKLYVKNMEKNNTEKDYELIEAQDIMGKMVRFQKSMENVYPDIECIELDDKQYKMDDWLQLLGMFFADGVTTSEDIYISALTERKIVFNINILTKLGIKYKYDNINDRFNILRGQYPEIYEELNKLSVSSLLPDYVWYLSKRQCIILLDALLQDDSHTYNDGFSRYGTNSLQLANDMCRLAVHCGWSGIIKMSTELGDMIIGSGKNKDKFHFTTYYKISIIRKKNQPYINKNNKEKEKREREKEKEKEEELINYKGKVYCIEMPSSHLYYMREHSFAPSMLIGNSRGGQKGTLGLIIPEEDMPFTAEGVRPDLIINPHALPSRMTIGQLVECLFGKACSLYGAYGDCTAFSTKGANYSIYGSMLTHMNFHHSGNEILYSGFTGEQLYSEIFIGPTYYMRLKHMVKDKINYRATGKRSLLTRQTNQGRANDGGLKIGEMERDGIMAHGMSFFLNESYMVRGDQYYMAVCNKTGTIAVYNPERNLFLSPSADGPLVYNTNVEGKLILDVISKHGRSFSLLRIPYALKLLIQELQVMNVQMRIITEDNIDQLLNLSYQSKNLSKLLNIEETGKEEDIKTIIEHYKLNMDIKISGIKTAQNRRARKGDEYYNIPEKPLYDLNAPVNLQTDFVPNLLRGTYYETNTDQDGNPLQPFYEQVIKKYLANLSNESLNKLLSFSKASKEQLISNAIGLKENGELLTDQDIDDLNNKDKNIENLYDNILTQQAAPAPYQVYSYGYPPASTAFVPGTPSNSDSPAFVPGTPEYNDSPAFVPGTPEYNDSPAFVPTSVSGSPEYNPEQKGGMANIFEDPNMNAFFNKLTGEKQAIILQMDPSKREIVMRDIIQRTGRQSQNPNHMQPINNISSRQDESGLTEYFNRLPVKNQLGALKNEYGGIAKEFNKLGGIVDKPKITIIKPQSAGEKLYGDMPLLKPLDSNSKSRESNNESNNESNSESNNESNTNKDESTFSESGIRKININ